MSQKTGHLQQENAKLREEIKRLRGALNSISQEIPQKKPVLKPRRELSPMSKDIQKDLTEEIDNRLNYVLPSKAILKKKLQTGKTEAFFEPGTLFSSYGHDEKFNFPDHFHTTELIFDELKLSSGAIKDPAESLIEHPNHINKNSDFPEFEALPKAYLQTTEPNVIKESFSSFYDDSLTKVQGESCFDEKQTVHVYTTQKVDTQDLPCEFSNFKSSPVFEPFCLVQPEEDSYREKVLLTEIEGLRHENMKLRLQLTVPREPLSQLPENHIKRPTSKTETSKSKSPCRKPIPKITPRPFNRNSSKRSTFSGKELTPHRWQHCHTCAHLLSKGYSTVHCSKHGSGALHK